MVQIMDEKVRNTNSNVPCYICGDPTHDYDAQVGFFYPNQAEFLCGDCYKRWKKGEFDGLEFSSNNDTGWGRIGRTINNPTKCSKAEKDMQDKLQCHYCQGWKWEWLITIDDSKVARLICEDCLSEDERHKN